MQPKTITIEQLKIKKQPPDSHMLEGKTALVTGGGSGIGEAISTRLIQAGAQVVIGGRSKDKPLNFSVTSRPPS